MSERDDELPDVPGAAHDADSTAREERIDALLSLSSTAPASLDANIAARRAAGDRVILPVEAGSGSDSVEASAVVGAREPRRPGLTLLLAVGLAAAAALVLLMRSDESGTGIGRQTPPDVAGTDTPAAPVVARTDSVARRDSTVQGDSSSRLTPRRDDVALGFERTQPAGASFGARLAAFSAAAIDSTVAAARRDPSAAIAIGYPGTSTELSALAERVHRELVAAGVAATRVARVPYPAAVMRADVSITVGGDTSRR